MATVRNDVPDYANPPIVQSIPGGQFERRTEVCNTHRAEWQDIIDRQLIEWGRNPDQFADDGVDTPSKETIARAINWAEGMRDADVLPPTTVVVDANGGVVVERREGSVAQVVHFWDDGSTEYMRFQGTKLVVRHPI